SASRAGTRQVGAGGRSPRLAAVCWPCSAPCLPGVLIIRAGSGLSGAAYRYGGGSTVQQRNTISQKTSWDHSWTAYKKGFGNVEGNHWQNAFAVRFVIINADGKKKYANYHSFVLDNEGNGYAWRLGDYSGDAGDALTIMYESGIHDNMNFSTLDKDQDSRISNNCALNYVRGWWCDNCDNGIYWKGLCTEYKPRKSFWSLKYTCNCSTEITDALLIYTSWVNGTTLITPADDLAWSLHSL
uniref:Fibrinogen C-terminal domain-containing protein n=1 Tax=Chelonoidis abingdonii TaxID=106734 RepID=A0A8C0GMT5_CHEAB